jgi:hypothetical protein
MMFAGFTSRWMNPFWWMTAELPRRRAVLLHQPVQVGALDVLHRDEVFVGRLAGGVADALVKLEPGDAGVNDPHHRLRLLLEPLPAGVGLLRQRLDGDVPGRVELPAEVHLALSALAELLEDEVLVEGELAVQGAFPALPPQLDDAPLILGEPRLVAVGPPRGQFGKRVERLGEVPAADLGGPLPRLRGDDAGAGEDVSELGECRHSVARAGG